MIKVFPTRWCLEGGPLNPPFRKPLSRWNFWIKIALIVRQTMIICGKKINKVYRFKMAAILLIFLLRDCAIQRKLGKKTHFPEAEFQRNLAQSKQSLIETHKWNKIFASKYANLCYLAGKRRINCKFFFRSKTHYHECDNDQK